MAYFRCNLKRNQKQVIKKVWTNSKKTSAFSAQTISLDLSEKAGVIVEYRNSTATDAIGKAIGYAFVENGTTFRINVAYGGNGNPSGNRNCTVSDTGVKFSTGYYWSASNGTVTSSSYIIPQSIRVIEYIEVDSNENQIATIMLDDFDTIMLDDFDTDINQMSKMTLNDELNDELDSTE